MSAQSARRQVNWCKGRLQVSKTSCPSASMVIPVRLLSLYTKNIKLVIASADMNPLLARMLLCAWTVIPKV